MSTVPKGKKILIGNKTYKEGAELPKDYKLQEKKDKKPVSDKVKK